ncbi:hypothetical protein K445DRAFT_304411 [Daldinia sp. EC12]|nr:hypothetical protein K445DRAFT_304411 [Daldinia sp. EC12]
MHGGAWRGKDQEVYAEEAINTTTSCAVLRRCLCTNAPQASIWGQPESQFVGLSRTFSLRSAKIIRLYVSHIKSIRLPCITTHGLCLTPLCRSRCKQGEDLGVVGQPIYELPCFGLIPPAQRLKSFRSYLYVLSTPSREHGSFMAEDPSEDNHFKRDAEGA